MSEKWTLYKFLKAVYMHFQGNPVFQKRTGYHQKEFQWEIVVIYILCIRLDMFDDFYSSAKVSQFYLPRLIIGMGITSII